MPPDPEYHHFPAYRDPNAPPYEGPPVVLKRWVVFQHYNEHGRWTAPGTISVYHGARGALADKLRRKAPLFRPTIEKMCQPRPPSAIARLFRTLFTQRTSDEHR